MTAGLHINLATKNATHVHKSDEQSRFSRKTLRLRLHISLIVLDIICIVLGFFAAHFIYPVSPGYQYLVISLVTTPVYIIAAFRVEAYSVKVIQKADGGVGLALQSFLIAVSFILFAAFYGKMTDDFSRVIFGLGIVNSMAMLSLSRAVFARRARSVLGGNPYSVVLITEEDTVSGDLDFAAIFSTSDFDPKGDAPFMYDRLGVALKATDRVIVACAPDRRAVWVDALKGANVQAEILVPELAETRPMAVAEHEGQPTIVVTTGPFSFPDRVVKRAFDVFAAVCALLFFVPLITMVGLAIKLETRGPVFFIQKRIGRGNQMFKMMKFRSMRSEASDGGGTRSTGRSDDRITAVGRFIRRTSIDELPQLFNVLWGHMSIVGPRPHALGSRAEDLLFWEIDRRYWHRHAAKPGLTGLAQVRGFRGATNHRDDLTNRLDADLEYLNNWSLWKDIKIAIMTLKVVVHNNAY